MPTLLRVGRHGLLSACLVMSGYELQQGVRSANRTMQIRHGSFAVDTRRVRTDVTAANRAALSVIETSGKETVLDLSGKNALLFFYSTACVPCNQNVPRWFDLVTELRQERLDVEIIAVGRENPDTSASYWSPVAGLVRVVMPVKYAEFQQHFNVSSTPTTVIVTHGTISAVVTGTLGTWRRGYILAQLSGR